MSFHRRLSHSSRRGAAFCATLLAVAAPAFAAQTEDLRIVSYNIEADVNGNKTPNPGLSSVLEAIGQQNVNGITQPIDILALQETTSNSLTVAPIVSDLNAFYGTGTYAMSTYQGLSSGNNVGTGNGPNALIYNTSALNLIASVGVSTPLGTSVNGINRQPIRYEFEPIGGSLSDVFYLYVDHYKSGATATDLTARNDEAVIIRADEATLPANARVLYMGDFNTGSSSEASYQTITAPGQGHAVDPINLPGNWASNTTFKGILTESATDLRFRDDFILATSNIITDPSGLQYVTNSYHVFGNNGSTAVNSTVDLNSNTALNGVPNAGAILTDLTTASDHLPVVADFMSPVPEPASAPLLLGLAVFLWRCRSTRRH